MTRGKNELEAARLLPFLFALIVSAPPFQKDFYRFRLDFVFCCAVTWGTEPEQTGHPPYKSVQIRTALLAVSALNNVP